MSWGLRNMKKYQLTSVSSPSIDFQIGEHKIETKVIKNLKRNPNFDEPLYFFDVVRLYTSLSGLLLVGRIYGLGCSERLWKFYIIVIFEFS